MSKKNLLWILVGIGYGIMLAVAWEESFYIAGFLFFFGSLILSIIVGAVSKNKYLPFVTVFSSFMTDYSIYAMGYVTDEDILTIFLFSGLYGIPGFIAAWIAKRRARKVDQHLLCPSCGKKVEKDWVSCPYCRTALDSTRMYTEDTRIYDDTLH